MSIIFIIEKFFFQEPPGWTSTVVIIILFSGFQIIFLGLIGEYLGKQYLDQNSTPQWIIREKMNCDI
jgi:undecaprenyl-phosphate 4-deoxy-4-formamido-L-arabinose transferase